MPAISLDEYKDAMRNNICSVCISFAADPADPSRCRYENSGQCSLFDHLDEVVNTVSKVDSGSIEPYLTELRRDVCAKCSHQNKQGVCNLRDARGPAPSWCVLDAYFNLIVGTIEEVQKSHATSAS